MVGVRREGGSRGRRRASQLVYLFIYLPVYPFIYLPVYSFIYLPVYSFIYLFIYLLRNPLLARLNHALGLFFLLKNFPSNAGGDPC